MLLRLNISILSFIKKLNQWFDYYVGMALLHKAILEGFFSNIISR